MDKHTPGPWHVMADGFSRKGLWSAPTVYATDDELRYVAVCACADNNNFHSATDNLANARLIASAPDLLAMLKVAQLWLDVDGRFDMQGINAAIARAEGRS